MENEVLTDEGLSYIERLTDYYDRASSRAEYGEIMGYFDFEVFDDLNWPPVGRLPESHENYGNLIHGDGDYVLKLRSFRDSIPVTKTDDRGDYQNQNFVEARVWLEERDSERSNFTPVRAFDADRGNWLIMDEVDQQLPVHNSHLDWVKEYMEAQGWDPHDLEIGLSGDNWKIYDYGRFQPLEDWKISEEEVLNSDIAVRNV